MTTLEIYPPVALYVAGRFAHLPRKGHVEDYAIAMNLDEQSLHDYIIENALFSPGEVVRSCDLQLRMADDMDEIVCELTARSDEVKTFLHRLAHCYLTGLPCNTFLG